jgi:hypothetical protein
MFEVMMRVWFGLLALGYSALFMAERAEWKHFYKGLRRAPMINPARSSLTTTCTRVR